MGVFQHYEDLRQIFTRLNEVLPGRPKMQGGCKDDTHGFDWRDTVIGAHPLHLSRLVMPPNTGTFIGDIPVAHQTCLHRRWFIAEQTQTATDKLTCDTDAVLLPDGMSIWHPTDSARRLTVLAIHDARAFFHEQSTAACPLPANDESALNGKLTLFATPGDAQLCLRDSLRLLDQEAPYLTRLTREYGRMLARMYGYTWQNFEEACCVHITRVESGHGIPARLLRASPSRYENGPVASVSLGRPVITHDAIPCILDPSCIGTEHPVRLEVGDGMLVICDGPSRMRYSHGYPAPQGTHNAWFMLTFFLDCTPQSVAVGYDRETRAVIMMTPMHREQVVSSQHTEMPAARGVTLDLMGVLVKNMRLRLRVAESHALAARHDAKVLSSSSSTSEDRSSSEKPKTMFLNSASSS